MKLAVVFIDGLEQFRNNYVCFRVDAHTILVALAKRMKIILYCSCRNRFKGSQWQGCFYLRIYLFSGKDIWFMKTLIIKRNNYIQIVEYCLQQKPLEACGILAGKTTADEALVQQVYLMKNIKESPEEYLMEPEEQFSVFKDIREKGQEMIAIFHSHPHSPARPSRKDIKMAYYPETVYAIVSLENLEQIVFRGFIINDEDYQEINIVVVD
jgi:proteasome lid subunit RPN8/RPN11